MDFFDRPGCERGRFQRLCDALTSVTTRVRDGVAEVVGDHAGDAVRAAVLAVLVRKQAQDRSSNASRRYPHEQFSARTTAEWGYQDDPYRDADEGDRWSDCPSDVPPGECQPPLWWSLLPPALHLLVRWLRRRTDGPILATLAIAGSVLTLAAVLDGLVALCSGC